jgi:hypothetical protein
MDEAKAALRERPGARVIGGGTLLRRELERTGWTGALLDLSRVSASGAWKPGQLGAAVTMDRLAVSGAAGLAPAAGSIGNPEVRTLATVGGNCSASVSGCVYLTLLALDATAVVLTPAGPRQAPLWRWNAASASAPLLAVRFDPAPVAFERIDTEPRAPRPLCAVALCRLPGGGGLRCAVGYAVDRPRLLMLDGDDPEPGLLAHVPPDRHDIAARCLRLALDTLRRSEETWTPCTGSGPNGPGSPP